MTGSATTYYTAVNQTIIQSMDLVNTSGAAVSCTVYRVARGDTAAARNTTISALSVAAGSTYLCPEMVNMVLEPGDFIQALGNGVTIMASGLLVIDDGDN